jgi:membrane-associated phospholipid phosphatase
MGGAQLSERRGLDVWPRLRPLDWTASRLILWALLAEFTVSTGIALAFGFRAASPALFLPQLWCILMVACGPLLRRIEFNRTAGALETIGLLYGQGFALGPLLYPLTAVSRPFADGLLASADKALGFNWLAFVEPFQHHPNWLLLARGIYFSFAWQGVVVFAVLFFSGRGERAWRAVLAANAALLATLLIYPLFPTQGAFAHFGFRPSDFGGINAVAWTYGPAIEAIRDHGTRLITPKLMVPFVSFPSYHAAAAVILAWAAWPTVLRWPFAILNALMVASAILIGGHYAVDLIAGCAISILLCRQIDHPTVGRVETTVGSGINRPVREGV